MKAARWFRRRDIRVENLPIPPVKPGHVRVKIAWAGVCGSDILEFVKGPIFIPTEPHSLLKTVASQTLGHETSRIVDAIGEGSVEVPLGNWLGRWPGGSELRRFSFRKWQRAPESSSKSGCGDLH